MGNFTAVSTHNQSKSVGKKPGCPKRKGPAQYKKKPEVEKYIDPFPLEAHSDSSIYFIPSSSILQT